jgi:hypothetical protein
MTCSDWTSTYTEGVTSTNRWQDVKKAELLSDRNDCKQKFTVKIVSPDQVVLHEFPSADWTDHIMSEKLCGVNRMIIAGDECWPIHSIDIDLDENTVYAITQREISSGPPNSDDIPDAIALNSMAQKGKTVELMGITEDLLKNHQNEMSIKIKILLESILHTWKKDQGHLEYLVATLADKASELLNIYADIICEKFGCFKKYQQRIHKLALDFSVVAIQYSKMIDGRERCLKQYPLLYHLYKNFWNDDTQQLQTEVLDLSILLQGERE